MSQQATVGACGAKQEEIFSKLSLDKHPWVKPASEARVDFPVAPICAQVPEFQVSGRKNLTELGL